MAQSSDLDHLPFDDRSLHAAGEETPTSDIVGRARHRGTDLLIFVNADEFPQPRGGQLDRLPVLARGNELVCTLRRDGPRPPPASRFLH